MRKLLFGLLGFATLGLSAVPISHADAQPYYRGYYHGPVVRRGYYARPYYGYHPARVVRRCWFERRAVWNGYRWIRRPIEVCRTVRRY